MFLFYDQTGINTRNYIFIAVQIGSYLHQSILWTFTPLVVQVLLNHFQKETKKKNEDLVQKIEKCLNIFESLTLSFEHFFLLYFSLVQFFTIFMTFLFLRSFYLFATFSFQGVLIFISFVANIACNINLLIYLTNSVNETNNCIRALERELEETLLLTEEKQERQYLKYLRRRFKDLKPMNASGYFTIDKTTLTSMLSVR